MKDKTIQDGATLASYIDSVIRESVKSAKATNQNNAISEKEKQQATANSIGKTAAKPGMSPAAKNEIADDSEKLESGDVSSEDIISKLNAIRSGKSFKDESISGAMDEYINSLTKPEKTALLAYVNAVAQIVTGMVSGDSAPEPKEPPSNVKMQKGKQGQKVHIEPNIIHTTSKETLPGKEEKKEPKEDTSAPVRAPITPKKR